MVNEFHQFTHEELIILSLFVFNTILLILGSFFIIRYIKYYRMKKVLYLVNLIEEKKAEITALKSNLPTTEHQKSLDKKDEEIERLTKENENLIEILNNLRTIIDN